MDRTGRRERDDRSKEHRLRAREDTNRWGGVREKKFERQMKGETYKRKGERG